MRNGASSLLRYNKNIARQISRQKMREISLNVASNAKKMYIKKNVR